MMVTGAAINHATSSCAPMGRLPDAMSIALCLWALAAVVSAQPVVDGTYDPTGGLATRASVPPRDGSRCLNDCGGVARGRCSGGETPLCACVDTWNGGAWDCSERACPTATAWWDLPTSDGRAHTTMATCAGRGRCEAGTGRCACDTDFEGAACQRLRCPGFDAGRPCSGRGRCVTLREANSASKRQRRLHASVSYSDWDADAIQGCVCDEGWGGYDCSQPLCPLGSDPVRAQLHEIQLITTTVATVVREVQRVTLSGSASSGGGGSGGTADVDEVQSLLIPNAAGVAATGVVALTFDSRGADGSCGLCTLPALATTANVTLTGVSATDATALQAALVALTNIGAGGVSVSVSSSPPSAGDALYLITFTGAAVGGNVTALSVTTAALTTTTQPTIEEVTVGSQLSGGVYLGVDDGLAWPTAAILAAGGDLIDAVPLEARGLITTGELPVTASNATVAAAIEAALLASVETVASGLPAVTATRVGTGGPGIAWDVTFTAASVRGRGNVGQIASPLNTLALSHPSLTAAAGSVAVSTLQNGTFLSGYFTLAAPYHSPSSPGGWAYAPATGPLPWNANASAIVAAFAVADMGYGIGPVTVSRARTSATPSTAWAGQYAWTVTFAGLPGDVADVGVASTSSLLSDGRTSGGVGVNVSQVQRGSGAAEVNEVQLVECRCTSCTNPLRDTVTLSWNGATTAALPFNVTSDGLRAALVALPGIPDVTVAVYDILSGTSSTWCDGDGGVAAITFTHNLPPVPPVLIAPTSVLQGGGNGTGVWLAVRRGDGNASPWGGRAQNSTRSALPCSGRGRCGASGTCTCYGWGNSTHYAASNNAGGYLAPQPAGYPSSNGSAEVVGEASDNCGYPLNATITACPSDDLGVQCSGVGSCTGAPTWRCVCPSNRTGYACELRACATANAWFDVPSSLAAPHTAGTTCAGRGVCNTAEGACRCGGRFTGAACQLMACPLGGDVNATTGQPDTCVGGRPCVTLQQATSVTRFDDTGVNIGWQSTDWYTTAWDAQQIRGCACRGNVTYAGVHAHAWQDRAGWDCGHIACPTGDDPEAVLAGRAQPGHTVQRVQCWVGNGSLALRFRNATTPPLWWNSHVAPTDAVFDFEPYTFTTVEAALRSINVTSGVHIQPSTYARRLCNPAGNASDYSFDVTFLALPGAVPLLEVIPDEDAARWRAPGNASLPAYAVTLVQEGRLGGWECSRRGVCVRETGRCACGTQYGSGDGLAGNGSRGDCGHMDAAYGASSTVWPTATATATHPAAAVWSDRSAYPAPIDPQYGEASGDAVNARSGDTGSPTAPDGTWWRGDGAGWDGGWQEEDGGVREGDWVEAMLHSLSIPRHRDEEN